FESDRPDQLCLSSTPIRWMSAVPTFSSVCGGNALLQTAVPASGRGSEPSVRESARTAPSASRRTKWSNDRGETTPGQRCVCTSVVSPGAILVSRTRTSSLWKSRWCVPGAATSASSDAGHVHSAVLSLTALEAPAAVLQDRRLIAVAIDADDLELRGT